MTVKDWDRAYWRGEIHFMNRADKDECVDAFYGTKTEIVLFDLPEDLRFSTAGPVITFWASTHESLLEIIRQVTVEYPINRVIMDCPDPRVKDWKFKK